MRFATLTRTLDNGLGRPGKFGWGIKWHRVKGNIGLVEPSLDCFSMICMASAGYHAVRRNVRKTNFRPVDELSSSDVRRFWTVFAEAYAADAREHNASCTKFSVPDFLNFLIACNQT